MRKIVTKTIIPALATSQIGELRHAAVVCVRPTVVLVPACRSGGGGVRAEGSGVPAVGGGRVGAVGEIVAVLHARGAVHGQHVHQPTPLRLQLLDLSLQVLVLIFQHFGLLYKVDGAFPLLQATLCGGDLVPLSTSPSTLLVLGRKPGAWREGIIIVITLTTHLLSLR